LIEMPMSNFAIEEILLVNCLNNYQLENILGPIDADLFWSLFILSLYINPLENYAYKTFVQQWHDKKGIPMPDLCIVQLCEASLVMMLDFVNHFALYFYNNNILFTNSLQMIKACRSDLVVNFTKAINISNEKIEVVLGQNPVPDRLKLFPSALYNPNLKQIALYFKTNMDELLFELLANDRVIASRTVDREQFKLVFTIDIDPNKCQLKIGYSSQKFELYFGQNETNKRVFDMSNELNDGIKLFFFTTDDLVYFKRLKCKKKLLTTEFTRPVKPSKLISISVRKKTFQPSWYLQCHGLDLDRCLLNFFNINRFFLYIGDGNIFPFQLLNSDQIEYIKDYGFHEPTRVIDIASNTSIFIFLFLHFFKILFDIKYAENSLLPIEYIVKEYNYSNQDSQEEKKRNDIFFCILQLSGQVCDNLMPASMYSNLLPRINYNLDDLKKYFALNINATILSQYSHNTSIKDWFAITCLQNIEFSYALQTHNNRTVHNDYYINFNFKQNNNQFVRQKSIDGIMKIFIISEYENEQTSNRSRRNFLYIIDTVQFRDKIIWFNQIHYDAGQMKFELHDKMKKDRRSVCYNIDDEVERSKCESQFIQEKQFVMNDEDELDESFVDSLVFKVYLYFHLKDGDSDLAHLFFLINEYKTGKKFYNQDFFSHLNE